MRNAALSRLCKLILALALCLAPLAAQAGNDNEMRGYSSPHFNKEAGGNAGYQVYFIPVNGGVRLLWRHAAGGKMAEPVVLDAVADGARWKAQLPGLGAGTWTVEEQVRPSTLLLTGPGGERIILRRLTRLWG